MTSKDRARRRAEATGGGRRRIPPLALAGAGVAAVLLLLLAFALAPAERGDAPATSAGSSAADGGSRAGVGGVGTPAELASAPGPAAPDFTVTLTNGERFDLSAHRGQTVVLEFLAPGCPSCAAELAALSRVAEDFKDRGVVVLVLDVGGMSRDKVAPYYQRLGGGDDLRYAPDEGQQVARQLQVRFLGTTIVLDRDGRELYRDGEGTREEDLVAAVTEAS
jgi:peroxiredoxin